MKYIKEPQKNIPISHSVDVLVAGGGPAGFSAAISAARQGVSVLLIEQTGQIGGVATTGLMSHWTGNTKGGFYQEILERSNGITMDDLEYYSHEQKTIDPEQLKLLMLEMLVEADVKLLLYTFASEVIMEGTTLKGIITESKSGREAIIAKTVIDCTGDGDIAAKAGAEFYKGREYDGKMQPMTIMFKAGGIDTGKIRYVYAFEQTYEVPAGDLQSLARKHLSYPAGHVLIYPASIPGVVTLNMTNAIKVDGTKASDLTQAEITCRSQMNEIISFIREFVPGCENAYIMSSASVIGVRETRHVKGEQMLTENDIMEARIFEDWVVSKAHFNFDVHNLNGAGLDETGSQKHFKQKKWYTIPYGCLLPAKIDNLVLAGRNISGTHMAHSSYRVMPICANMGQAAGIAAAAAVQIGVTPREVPVGDIQKKLLEAGVPKP